MNQGIPVTGPAEGVPFLVDPASINYSLFQNKRSDPDQEAMRQWIIQGLDEAKKHPESYGKPYMTLMPEKTWDGWEKITYIEDYANEMQGRIADMVEWSIRLAQRVQNGEPWEDIANLPDTAPWFLLVRVNKEEFGKWRCVGGSSANNVVASASYVQDKIFRPYTLRWGDLLIHTVEELQDTVPLIVLSNVPTNL